MKLKLLSEYKEIPDDNCVMFDEGNLMNLYDDLEEKFLEEKRENDIQNRIIIFDDCGYSGSLKNKQSGIISKLICNGRHLNVSQIYSSQRFSQVSTTLRSNITGAILFNTSTKELDLITDDMSYMENRKDFIKLFRKETSKEIRSFLVVNFTNPSGLYMNSEFETISE